MTPQELDFNYREYQEELNKISELTKKYINQINSLLETFQDFEKYCEEAKNLNKSRQVKYKNLLDSANPPRFLQIDFTGLKGTHYLAHIKRYAQAFEGTSKIFREKLNG